MSTNALISTCFVLASQPHFVDRHFKLLMQSASAEHVSPKTSANKYKCMSGALCATNVVFVVFLKGHCIEFGDTSGFVTPAGQLLLPGGVRPECIPSA